MRIPGHRPSVFGSRLGAALAVLAVCAACGKKAPPLAPLNMAPEAPSAVTARRLGDTVYIQLTVPAKSMSGRGGFSIDHLDVYAVTIAPGTPMPPNRDLLKPEHVIAKIPVQPPPDPDEAPPDTPDTRPLPGETITFVEPLTAAQLEPQVITKPVPPEKAPKPPTTTRTPKTSKKAKGGVTAPATTAAPATPPPPVGPAVLTRIYVVEGVPKNGKGAMPSARMPVPLFQAPGAPRPGTPTADETSVTLAWQPPPSTTDELPGVLYNVYAAPAPGSTSTGAAGTGAAGTPGVPSRPSAPKPLNDQPLAEQTFTHAGAEPGKAQCFVVRSVAMSGTTAIESEASDPVCITPKDTFPPAAPKGLAAVASAGVINLIWDANTEADVAGYVILRGDAPGDTLQPLMRDPIRETRYGDRTVRPGARYVYQIVAVDKAGNRSAPSNKVEEAAR